MGNKFGETIEVRWGQSGVLQNKGDNIGYCIYSVPRPSIVTFPLSLVLYVFQRFPETRKDRGNVMEGL